ncbi:MAG: helicase-related protein, partial [Christensenellaceae bacterium]
MAYIHEAKKDNEKLNLFNKVNAGKIRILLGSTEKCGAGTNVQKRLKAIHHLDAPYRPRDLIQRNGRGVRQGNMNKSVAICTYVMERTFDSYS